MFKYEHDNFYASYEPVGGQAAGVSPSTGERVVAGRSVDPARHAAPVPKDGGPVPERFSHKSMSQPLTQGDASSRATHVSDEMRFRVLRALEQQPDLSQRQLAKVLGVSLGKANYLLRALLDKGLVKACNFRNNQNKLAYAYLLTPKGLAQRVALTRSYLERKTAEYESLKIEIERLSADVASNKL